MTTASSPRSLRGGAGMETTFEPVVEIFAEVSLCDLVFEHSMGRRHDWRSTGSALVSPTLVTVFS